MSEMTDRDLLAQALEALQWEYGGEPLGKLTHDTIQAIKARLAEDDDEPVGYITYIEDAGMLFTQDEPERGVYEPVYARPQPRARLTDEEILKVAVKAPPIHPWW